MSPAPEGNRNAMTWGGRGWAAIGSLPKGFSAARRYVGRMRAELESCVCELKGSVGVLDAATIQSACRHEGRALLLTRWLRTEHDRLTISERMALAEKIGAATDSRDRCLARLGLEATPEIDAWAHVDALLAEREQDEPNPENPDPGTEQDA